MSKALFIWREKYLGFFWLECRFTQTDNYIPMLNYDPCGILIKAGIQLHFPPATLAVFSLLSPTNLIKHLLVLEMWNAKMR